MLKNQDFMEMDLSPLERIITTPGLQHIAESIFDNVPVWHFGPRGPCRKVNKNWKNFLERLWIYYCETLPAIEKRKRISKVKNGSKLSSDQ